MISHTAINARSFIYCIVYQGPNETTTYFNDNNGYYHSALYLIEGTLDVAISDTEVFTEESQLPPAQEGVLYDISHTRGKYVLAKTQSSGAAMVTFNPVPTSRNLNIEILKDKQTVDINATKSKITIVCLTGPVDVNGKTLKSTQHALVYEKKSAT